MTATIAVSDRNTKPVALPSIEMPTPVEELQEAAAFDGEARSPQHYWPHQPTTSAKVT
ncbi:hypothetical protein [Nodosilinea sp. FACHB-13]|uniref:hypothetical protein n=1 Tax=Cyanophyceae TaxID=3028117 RepID=UPI001686A65E|nr:hypothetical protein [Nodosilinea sp. FACHB-13]MBD2107593.1 hypothetical protein [Nodosilinea sp. FACHB-13]